MVPAGVVDTLFICPAQIFLYSLYHGCKCWCAGPTSQKTVEATAGGERATGSRPGLASFPSPSLGTTGNRNLAPMLCPPAVGIDKRGEEEESTYFGVHTINTSCP